MKKNKTHIDWTLIFLFFLLISIGWINIYSTTVESFDSFNFNTSYGRQLIWISSAILLAIFTFVINYRFFPGFATPIYFIFILLLLLVIVVGESTKGASSWFGFGSLGIQPAEFAKYATCLLLARYIANNECDLTKVKNLSVAILIIVLPLFFILLQNDTGSALPFLFLFIALYREGLFSWILIAGLTAIVLFILLVFFKEWIIAAFITFLLIWVLWLFRKKKRTYKGILLIYATIIIYIFTVDAIYTRVLKDYQRARIEVLFGKIEDSKGIDYNVIQSKIAIGSGGLLGKGFRNGTQTNLNFVPEQSTDFIFCTIGEEWGFVGSSVVVLLYAWLIIHIFLRSEQQRVPFVRIYGYCIACIFFAHFTINIGMTLGIMPVIGIPLPFISYGGSSLLAYTLMLFTFINLDAKTNLWN
ncbi:MAG TPA: rod shape-determining protein RodA [Bacteroidales bacterium]|jgi:rod shape determining protein RodA|nr:rod shape-determining protein RodA [Bacteroidales bacterium]HOF16342.1 rod shape-determining protein RodA [Bacteroidales bacterium]HOR81908.1 rod shape-determining protein RodA [Bacteroidales bacterium]HPJ91140.1 rod shape-determining protein RodA [Bacteroidales bacterium]HQB19902.1 rod shape-determining protein RodA [Bacteroidales bacterium]